MTIRLCVSLPSHSYSFAPSHSLTRTHAFLPLAVGSFISLFICSHSFSGFALVIFSFLLIPLLSLHISLRGLFFCPYSPSVFGRISCVLICFLFPQMVTRLTFLLASINFYFPQLHIPLFALRSASYSSSIFLLYAGSLTNGY